MNKIIVAVVLCFLCLGVVEHQYLSATKKVALLTRQIDTIKIQSAVERQVLLNANDSLTRKIEAHRRVIKMHGKAIKEIAKLTSQMDSVLAKEIKHSSLAYTIGKRLQQVGKGLLGL